MTGVTATAPDPSIQTGPVVRAAAEAAARLAGEAARLERDGVTRADSDRLAADGLYAVYGPPELGGGTPAEQRRVAELLSGASPDAWFVWFQHGPVVRMLGASNNTGLAAAHVAALCAGTEQGGVAYSHLRTARPSVMAERVDGGWALTGRQPWCTGWGLVDVVLAGALVPATDEVLFGLVRGGDQPGLRSLGELPLAAMAGTSTHVVAFDNLVLPEESVVALRARAEWTAYDSGVNANVQPSTFGIALAALDLLQERAPRPAAALRERVLGVRTAAYRLLDEVDGREAHDERLALRAQALLLGIECTTALLTARGGQGMGLDDPAQRLLRAAAFQVVHSQAAPIRAATLDALVA